MVDTQLIDAVIEVAKSLLDMKVLEIEKGTFARGFKCGAKVGNFAIVGGAGTGGNVYFSFSGRAFGAADSNFCKRIFEFLEKNRSAKITRVDLAFDDFEGKIFPVRRVKTDFKLGHFKSSKGASPSCEERGDWSRGDLFQRGLTFYVGSRTGGMLLRFYEKGREQGCKESEWVRAEVEIRSSVFSIPSDVLLNPTGFFIGCKPYLLKISFCGEVSRVERLARESIVGVEGVLAIIKNQYGRHLNVLRKQYFSSDKELLDAVCRADGVIPDSLQKINEKFSAAEGCLSQDQQLSEV